jgi:hypothetical protein
VNATCFSIQSSSITYLMNTPPPSYISYTPGFGNYLQTLNINIEIANSVMGTFMSMSYINSIKATYLLNDYLTPFKVTLFKCYDALCLSCSFDSMNELIGSKLCSQCKKGYKVENNGCIENCGDGFIFGKEKCDDNKKGGCKEDCSGSKERYTCTGGNETSPSLCSALPQDEVLSSSSLEQLSFIKGEGIAASQSLGYITTAASLTSSTSLGPQIFVTAGANLLIRTLPFMSTFHNSHSEAFLRKGSIFFDFDFMPLSLLDIFNIKDSPHFVLLAPSPEVQDLGLSTLTSAMTLFIKLIQFGLVCSALALLTSFFNSLSTLSC